MAQLAGTLTHNRILDALPKPDFACLRRHLETVRLTQRQVVYQPGDKIDFIYFPIKGALSVLTLLRDGSSTEVGTVGHEGLLGLSALLGNGTSLHEVVVQAAGSALRGRANLVHEELKRSNRLRELISEFSQFVFAEVSQNVACSARHPIQKRCARWLLRMRDTLEANEFSISQEFLADMLGVERTSVTAIAQELRQRGLIGYHRGRVAILNGAELEAAACECYGAMKIMRDRLFHD